MNRSLLWRGILIFGLVALAALAAFPLDERIRLGLDLRGGMHLLLEVQTEDAVQSELGKDMDRFLDRAEDVAEITGLTGQVDGAVPPEQPAAAEAPAEAEETAPRSFRISGATPDQDDELRQLAEDRLRTANGNLAYSFRRSGGDLLLQMENTYVRDIQQQSVTQAVETIRNRVDAFGVSEPIIQTVTGSDRIIVQLPGVDDLERVRNIIKQTAFLEFRLTDYPRGGGYGVETRGEVLGNYGGSLPANVEMLEVEDRRTGGPPRYMAVERSNVITGRDLRDARRAPGELNEPVVSFTLTPEGGRIFGETTGENIGRGLAIVLDGQVVSAPVLEGRINDQGIIRGNFTPQEVDDLAMVLRSGALPAGITSLEERTVGATLGHESIRAGLRAGLIGLGLVILTMLVVYKLTGINAVVALLLDMVLVFGALAYFGATLTLPGIAGLILTIGMAVDANVLVFERIKEELRLGRTVRSAIDAGFQKALSSILDANVTTLIAALFLFQFGTGPIRGFAVTLSIGIFASVFTAVVVSRWIFDLILSRRARVGRISI